MKLRNAANSAWITLFQLDGEWSLIPFENGTAAAPSIYFKDSGTDTGIYSPGTDQVGISAGGTSRFEVSTTATTSTLPVVHPLGAVGTPSITFTGDLNTGIWSPAADTIAASTGGSERLRITSAGLAGIGSIAPVRRLHVAVAGSDPQLRLQDTSASESIWSAIEFIGDSARQAFIGKAGSTDLLITNDNASGALRFSTNATERARITSDGKLLVGTSTARTSASHTGSLQLEGTSFSTATASIITNANDSTGAYLHLGKARGGSIGNTTVVQSGDTLGQIHFTGSDGTNLINGAFVSAVVDGTPGTNDMPCRLVLSTTSDGASSPTERMRISNQGTTTVLPAANLNAIVARARDGASSGGPFLYLGYHSATDITSGTYCFSVATNGNVQNTNGSYTAISDAKLKENIVDASSQWDDLKSIKIRNWNFKEETGHETHRQIGPIAQELETVCPGLVFEAPDLDEDGNETGEVTKGVNLSVLYMKAVKALQEAMERIEQLETEMAEVKAQLQAL